MATRDKNPHRHDRKTQERQRERSDRDEPRERRDRERGDRSERGERSAPRGRDERSTPQTPRRENSSTTGAQRAKRPAQRPTPAPTPATPPRPAEPDDPLRASVSTGASHLRLLLRDPHYAWAFWEITADAFEAARQRLGRFSLGAELVLRVHSGGPGAVASWRRGTWDTPIEDWIGARPVLLGPAGVQHIAAVGLRAAAPPHVFVAIARSEPLIPPDRARHAAPPAEPVWSAPNANPDAHLP